MSSEDVPQMAADRPVLLPNGTSDTDTRVSGNTFWHAPNHVFITPNDQMLSFKKLK